MVAAMVGVELRTVWALVLMVFANVCESEL